MTNSNRQRGQGVRPVGDEEISPYQGVGGTKQMQRAQSRKRRQVRNAERSIWDNLAPKEYHGILSMAFVAIFLLGMVGVAAINGYL